MFKITKIKVYKEMLLKGYKISTRQKYELWNYISRLEQENLELKARNYALASNLLSLDK